MTKYDYAVVIGRFQPIHVGHVRLINQALEKARHVIVAIGSANAPRTPRNPFSFEERKALIRAEFPVTYPIDFVAIDDMLYNDGAWIDQVYYKINSAILKQSDDPEDVDVALFGYEKDATSYYLRYFPQWKSEFTEPVGSFNSTEIREYFYRRALDGKGFVTSDAFYGEDFGLPLDSPVFDDHRYQDLMFEQAKEWDFNKNYDPSKYPIFVSTVDTVVTANNHVLLVKRKHYPGKGLLALPGGHINEDETLEQAALRELREETSIDRSDRVLKANIRKHEIFDNPQRSERGRVITTAYHIQLPDEDTLPKVKGGDDAEKARWVPLSQIRKDNMFEDHYDIAKKMTRAL